MLQQHGLFTGFTQCLSIRMYLPTLLSVGTFHYHTATAAALFRDASLQQVGTIHRAGSVARLPAHSQWIGQRTFSNKGEEAEGNTWGTRSECGLFYSPQSAFIGMINTKVETLFYTGWESSYHRTPHPASLLSPEVRKLKQSNQLSCGVNINTIVCDFSA